MSRWDMQRPEHYSEETETLTFTCIPALLTTIEEAPASVLRKCLKGLCSTSGANAKRVSETVNGGSNAASKPSNVAPYTLGEDGDEIQLLLQQALDDRKKYIASRQYKVDRRRCFDKMEEEGKGSVNLSESENDISDADDDAWEGLEAYNVAQHYNTLPVDDIGPSGKCSSYSYSKNPYCAQRTDKAYIDDLRAKAAAHPSRSRGALISAEKKLEKDTAEVALWSAMKAIENIPARMRKCQHCKEKFDANWNDYESCVWYSGRLNHLHERRRGLTLLSGQLHPNYEE
ncbi:MAG: hypothetical protein Q9167_002810 [Letrouitia subvulpina]